MLKATAERTFDNQKDISNTFDFALNAYIKIASLEGICDSLRGIGLLGRSHITHTPCPTLTPLQASCQADTHANTHKLTLGYIQWGHSQITKVPHQ